MRDSRKLMIIGVALWISFVLFTLGAELVLHIVRGAYQYHSKPSIQLVEPPRAKCKICHCGQTFCHRECGEENMCNLRCEGLCQTKK